MSEQGMDEQAPSKPGDEAWTGTLSREDYTHYYGELQSAPMTGESLCSVCGVKPVFPADNDPRYIGDGTVTSSCGHLLRIRDSSEEERDASARLKPTLAPMNVRLKKVEGLYGLYNERGQLVSGQFDTPEQVWFDAFVAEGEYARRGLASTGAVKPCAHVEAGDYCAACDYGMSPEQAQNHPLTAPQYPASTGAETTQSCNYVADHDTYPEWIEFANGRTVSVATENGKHFLRVGWTQPNLARMMQLARAENDCGGLAVGGLAVDAGLYTAPQQSPAQEQGAVTQAEVDAYVNAVLKRPGRKDPYNVYGMVLAVAEQAVKDCASLRAERDEALKQKEHYFKRIGDACKQMAAAEAARDAYKAALESVKSDFETDYVLDGVIVDNPAFSYRMSYKTVCAALSRDSTANSPTILDSSRDEAGAGKEATK